MKVAVVGAGISGLAAAYHLAPRHEVTLYERAPTAGGHAHTALVSTPDGLLAVDTGFIVYNETTYPGFTRLLRDLGVRTQPSDMSFSSRCRACGVEFSSRGLGGFFARRSAILAPAHWQLLAGMRGFFADARAVLDGAEPAGDTLGEYLTEHPSRAAVGRHFLVPMAAAIWSTAPDDVLAFPFEYLVRFLDNHGLVGFRRTLQWRTVAGGSREYVTSLLAALPPTARVRLGADVRAVTRGAPPERGAMPTVEVVADGVRESFDAVVLATHADQALRVLHDATPEERTALGAFGYTHNRVVLHTDPLPMPRRSAAHASWNVLTPDCARPAGELTMTYDLSRLQSLPGPDRYYVSVNPPQVDPRRIIAEYAYDHPQYDFGTLAAQARIEALQGTRGVYFAGAHLGHGFHEDGYRAGAEAARRIDRHLDARAMDGPGAVGEVVA